MKKQPANTSKSVFALAVLLGISILLYFLGETAPPVWVMDQGDLLNETRLVKLCSNGTKLLEVQFGQSGAIGFDPIRNIIWAPELNDIDQIHFDQVVKVDAAGNIVDRIYGYRTAVLAVSPNDGSVWVLSARDNGDPLLSKIASNGKLLFTYDVPSSIYTMAVDPRDDSLWFGGNRMLAHISTNGEWLFESSDISFFSAAPHQIVVHPTSGDVWHTNSDDGSVHKRSPDGRLLKTVHSGFSMPLAIAMHPAGESVWVAYYNPSYTGAVVKISPAGEILFSMTMSQQPHMVGIHPSDGMVWVGFRGGILKLHSDGKIAERINGLNHPISIVFANTTENKYDWMTKIKCFF